MRHIRNCSALFLVLIALPAFAQVAQLIGLKPKQMLHGFRTEAVYVDNSGKPMGARFIHARTGFIFDYLQIQSVPQHFIWVNSFPTSDMGEPHTQEHLLLGKGNKGRYVANLEAMSLTESSAFTEQWRTCYDANTAAGPDTYFKVFQAQLDALLHPDYSDEEISREVANYGVDVSPTDKTLRIDEKGTVYNEMVSSDDKPWSNMSRDLGIALYGAHHPLAFESGGRPSALRELKPADIRTFHHENYHLGNMGMVGAYPKEMTLDDVLEKTNMIFDALQPQSETEGRKVSSEATLPRPITAKAGTIMISDYPDRNPATPGPVVFAWMPDLQTGLTEDLLMNLFLENFAGDASTNLYKRFIDTKTRTLDVGATGVFAWASTDQGHPISVGLDGVNPQYMNDQGISAMRKEIMDEMAKVGSYADGSPELADFNARIASRITDMRRSTAKFVNTPPGFGFRNIGSAWMDHLRGLEKIGDFSKSVTLKPQLDSIERLVTAKKNVWRGMLQRWTLSNTQPIAGAAHPSPALVDTLIHQHEARIAAKTAELRMKYHASSDQEALAQFQKEYDRETAVLDEVAKKVATPPFISNPPLTLDDQLDYKASTLARGIPMVQSKFENMTGATVGLALNLHGIQDVDLYYLSLLPALLTQTGVIENGKAVSFEEASERMRKEISGMNAYFATSFSTGRTELALRGSGNDLPETQKAIHWMELALYHPNWTVDNLPRIRDVVNQSLAEYRSTMQGSEESWVNNPANAFWRQSNPLLLATSSFLTQEHNAFRLRWLLMEATAADRTAISEFLDQLAVLGTSNGREHLEMITKSIQAGNIAPFAARQLAVKYNALSASGRSLAVEAATDLARSLGEIPDATLPADWKYLCREIRDDLLVSPAEVLAHLNTLRERLLITGNARMFEIGSGATMASLSGDISKLLEPLKTEGIRPVLHTGMPLVYTRVGDRAGNSGKPQFVGLVNPNSSSGVFLNSAAGTSYRDTDKNSLTDFLASMLYSGHGAHGIFMKTWGAGLAYSNGLRNSLRAGRISYYAERCPLLSQTLRFVIDQVKTAPRDTSLLEYAVAQAFGEFRSASTYEARGEAVANDIADGLTPEVVSNFRKAVLGVRYAPGLANDMYDRVDAVYRSVLPGYTPGAVGHDAINFVIGPEKQFAQYEEYLRTAYGPDIKLVRLYPRDFWMAPTEVVGDIK